MILNRIAPLVEQHLIKEQAGTDPLSYAPPNC